MLEGVFNSINLKTFRVVFPRCYLTGEDWNLACKTPVKLLSSILPVGVTFRAYGWHHNPATKEEAVIGFCKLPDSVSENPMTKSGWKAGFFQPVNLPGQPEPSNILWIPNTNKNPAEYLRDARKQAREKQVGLALRRGGNSNLGLLGCKSTNEAEQMQRRRWVAKMVPHTWTPAQFQTVLEKAGWRVLAEVTPPQRRGGVWTFRGAQPESGKTCFMLDVSQEKNIVIVPWLPKFKKPATTPVWTGKQGWITTSEPQSTQEISDDEGDKSGPAPTQLDTATQNSQEDVDMETGGGVKRGQLTSPSKPEKGGLLKKKLKTDLNGTSFKGKGDHADGLRGPHGQRLWDLSGTGDCGFRCLSAHAALRNGKSEQDISSKIDKLALSLRTKVQVWLKGNNSWRNSWYHDSDTTEETEGGVPAKQASDYVETVGRASKWMDSWCAMAASEILLTDVMVFKYVRGEWKFLQRFKPAKKTAKDPMVLCLKNGHFLTLPPKAEFPQQWKGLGLEDDLNFSFQSFLGGVYSKKSCSSLSSSWLAPQKDEASSSSQKDGNFSEWIQPQSKAGSSRYSSWLQPQLQDDKADTQPCQRSTQEASLADTIQVDLPQLEQLFQCQKRRITGKQKVQVFDPQPQKEFTWVCPVCQTQFSQRDSSSLSQSKRNHLMTRHPEFNLRLVVPCRGTRLQVVEPSEQLPDSQRAWTCVLCKKGLPPLPRQDYRRAVRLHCEKEHPEETPRTLFHKAATGRKKKKDGVSTQQIAKHNATRQQLWPTHQVILLPREKGDMQRGRVTYCGRCLTRLGRVNGNVDTCDQAFEKLQKNPHSKKMKRDWWNRLLLRDPEHANQFLQHSGWEKDSLEAFLAPVFSSETKKRAAERRVWVKKIRKR